VGFVCSRVHLLLGGAAVPLVALGSLLAAAPSAAGGTQVAQVAVISPLSASGCNGNVCIDVQGSGSTVNDWNTTAWATTYVCTQAQYWANYVLEHQGSSQCVHAGTELVSDWKNTWWPNGTVLCNTWPGIPGEPCETIEG